ncbi:hypothetical protein RXV86_04770 [Alisedimentitalea sp. MJ-SS2]|uniref:hypothetical protein n=1 Tax=Aliisedimentitalea sp. MJ-SS2 TaxID=3049795 RepID=UPI00290C67B4|nr:hypothetical protein [Alisedimentitalea sp. MJ-SS2]MDU8926693.1 hypothetical protein [Alisedimentitalea sp. MJ-SS2]
MRGIALSCLVLLGSPALAEPPLSRHFGAEQSCYERVYSDSHLAQHPLQRVTHIRLTHDAKHSGPFGTDGKPMLYPDAPEIVVNFWVALRGYPDMYNATGFCWPEGDGMGCGLECDGGQFSLEDRGPDQILLKINNEIYFHDCDEGEEVLTAEPDDKSFLMTRVESSLCALPE